MGKIREYNKLVRHKIPQIIKDNGSEPRLMNSESVYNNIDKYLTEKLLEELSELIAAKSGDEIIEEAADLYQVILEYVRTKGFNRDDLETVRQAKEVKCGNFLGSGFPKYLIHVEDPD